MAKNGKNGDELHTVWTNLSSNPYGFLFKCKNYCMLQITWNHDKRCFCTKANFFNAEAKIEELNMSVLWR